ncbi:arsenate-mycothiol transferase ArsC [Methylacidimicrobium tartarophylax]|uniref:Arsenate reductase n=1 Tax=Methylacidimicrobium tartarophylax TaxID=1041768 RepID=A0A5E6M6T5_9BACT|nr:low molecular weight phosphatase family protein [Methylacidimicrobium tartarophylax]VVM05067.1 arsenate reductase [Methylacidimicrobium tartarophylax]
MCANLLFICTGNYYRSRFAEVVFNFYSSARDLPWRASSRGLAVGPAPFPISPFARSRLQELGIPLPLTIRSPLCLREADLAQATRAIALQEWEHRPMIVRLFPQWLDRISFWDIDDVDRLPAAVALSKIENRVHLLLEELAGDQSAETLRKTTLETT